MSAEPIRMPAATPSAAAYESLTAQQLAGRLNVPDTWVYEQVRSRAADPIPHQRYGRYCRFLWGSPALNEWLARRAR